MTDVAEAAGAFSAWEWTLAIRYLRPRRKESGVALVTLLALAGIAITVAGLIIVTSVMNGFRTELLSRMLGFNGHIYVQGAAINGPDRDALVSRLRAIPGVVEAVPMVEAQGVAIGPRQLVFTVVRGLAPADLRATRVVSGNIKAGSIAGFGEGEEGGDLILAGSRLAAATGVGAGDGLTIISPSGGETAFGSAPRRKTYTVGGVFSVGMSEYDAAYIYMPLRQAQLFFGREGQIGQVEIKVADPDHLDAVRAEVSQMVGAGAVVADWRDRNQSFFNALQVERSVMRLILMIVVAIAALNIVSGLIMLVKNKGRDIAILRTMGAGRGAVLRIFFLAGSLIGAGATAVGITLGVLFCLFIGPIQGLVERVTGVSVFSSDVYYLAHIPARVEPGEVVLVVVWSLLAACLSTLPVAWWASRLEPVEALRYE